MMDADAKRILLVEDEMILAVNMKMSLEEAGYRVSIAIEGEEALVKAEEERPDIVLMDITLSGEIDGIEAAKRIMERQGAPVIYITGNTDERTIESAKQTNPVGFLQKPVDDDDLMKVLAKLEE